MAGALKHGGTGGDGPDRAVDARTLGEWLEERLRQADPTRQAGESPALEHRRIAEALERLARRLDAQERRSSNVAETIDHAMLDLRERMSATEGLQADTADRLLRTFLSLERTQTALADRIGAIESEAVGPQSLARFEAQAKSLAAMIEEQRSQATRDTTELRDSIASLASAAQESLQELESRLANGAFASREALGVVEREARGLRGALERTQREMHARLEQLAEQADRSAQHSELAALGRQAAALADRQDSAITHLSARVEALSRGAVTRDELEAYTRDAAQALAERLESRAARQEAALAALAERQDESAQALRGRIETLRDQIVRPEDLDLRLQSLQAGQNGALDAVEARVEALTERLPDAEALAESARQVSATLAALSERLGAVEQDRTHQHTLQDRRLSELRSWVEAAEGRAEAAAESARATAMQRYEELARLSEQRIAAAEQRSADALDAFAEEQRTLHGKLAAVTESRISSEAADLRAELERSASALAERAEAAIESARRELDARLAAAIAQMETGAMASGMAAAMERVGEVEAHQKTLARDVSVELRRWTEAIDKRMRGVDGRLTAEGDALQRLAERFERLESHAVEAAGHTREALSKLEGQIEERASIAERRAAQALEQVGAQIVELADRLDQRQRAMLREASERLEVAERNAARSAVAYAEEMSMRLEALEARVQPVTAPPAEAHEIPAQSGAATAPDRDEEDFRPPHLLDGATDGLMDAPEEEALDGAIAEGAAEDAFDAEPYQVPQPQFEDTSLEPGLVEDPLYVEDFEQNENPRYDFVDALDAILNQPSTPAPSLTGRHSDRYAEGRGAEPDMASQRTPGHGLPTEEVGWSQSSHGAMTGFETTRDQPPLDPTEIAEDLFDPPGDTAPAAASSQAPASAPVSHEPSYLAAARRAAKERVEAAAAPRKPKTAGSSSLMRALLWGAAAVALGSSIYALSRNERGVLGGDGAAEPGDEAEQKGAALIEPATLAAQRVMQAAADRIALGSSFEPSPVDLPEDGEEPAVPTISAQAAPLDSLEAPPELQRAGPRG